MMFFIGIVIGACIGIALLFIADKLGLWGPFR